MAVEVSLSWTLAHFANGILKRFEYSGTIVYPYASGGMRSSRLVSCLVKILKKYLINALDTMFE